MRKPALSKTKKKTVKKEKTPAGRSAPMELKRVEEALWVSEEKFRALLESIEDGYYESDLAGNFTFFNDSLCRIWGYPKEDLMGMNNRQYMDDRIAAEVYAVHNQVYKTGKPVRGLEFEIISKDGTRRIIQASFSLLKNREDQPIGFRGVARDITAAKKTETMLRQREDRLKSLFDNSDDGVFVSDFDGNFLDINQTALDKLGYRRDEILSLNFASLLDQKQVVKAMQVMDDLLKTGIQKEPVEFKLKRKDGGYLYVESKSSLVYRDGKPATVIGIARDVTERKLMEEELRRSEERYRSVLEEVDEGYYEDDLDGTFTFVNDAEVRILGYPKEELVGMNYRQYCGAETAREMKELFSRTYKTGEPFKDFEAEFIAKDGTKRIAEISGALVHDKEGIPAGFRGIARDITERKQMEEKIRQSEEKYRGAIEQMQDAYYEIDLNGNYTYVNDAICRVFKLTKEELIGTQRSLQRQDEANAKKSRHAFMEVYRTGAPIQALELDYIQPDGKSIGNYELSISLIRNAQGQPTGFRGISRDITERKQMEEELRKSEERYRSILEDIDEGYYENDLEGTLTFVNDALARNLGYSKEELIGMNYRQYNTEDTAARLRKLFSQVYKTGEPFKDFEAEFISKDGAIRIAAFSGTLIRDNEGKPIGFRGTSRDITKRKLEEEALRQSEAKYLHVIESIGDAYFEADLRGVTIFVNDKACLDSGYTREEMLRMSHRELQTAENAKKTFNTFNKVYQTGLPDTCIYEIICKDGTSAVFELSVSLMRDAGGKPIGFRGLSRDIAERRTAEEALRQSEEKYRTILESMEDGYYELDMAGNLTFFNDAFCRIWGYPKEELIGMNNRKYMDAETAANMYAAYNEVYKTGKTGSLFDFEIIRKDGARRIMQTSFSLLKDKSDRPIGFRGTVRDVTERKRMEDEIIKSEQKYRSIVENSQEGIFQASAADQSLTVNSAFAAILAYDSPEEASKSVADRGGEDLFVNPGDYENIRQVIRREGRIIGYETELYRKDKNRIWVNMSISSVTDSSGALLYYGILEDITPKKILEQERQENINSLRKSLGATISAMSATVEAGDPYTAGHQRRVADLARAIATEMKLPRDRIDGIRLAGMIHDLGKISVPSEILTKPTRLTDLEFELIKTHSEAGYNILKDIDFPWPIARMVREHHERINGSGYPQGLKRQDILIESRILAVADVVEAMSSNRPYRPANGIAPALDEIEKNKGILYDEVAADVCLMLFREGRYKLPE
ncbi:MAG: PAS domain S-box protein [Deltaproteobacteria bacterium]|nr:PAS domain S-box protein [Deltaproteobacteria bacterium]